mmetsp:Transcript_70017/g.195900  ORF Transcript_70017/g.195900 Transcript_70017/m.195900 type:complete len:205 (+) Transcript_70017:1314-1928(+)
MRARRERERGGGRWHVRAHLGRNLRAGRARWWPEFVRKRLLLDRVECVDCFPSVGLSIGQPYTLRPAHHTDDGRKRLIAKTQRDRRRSVLPRLKHTRAVFCALARCAADSIHLPRNRGAEQQQLHVLPAVRRLLVECISQLRHQLGDRRHCGSAISRITHSRLAPMLTQVLMVLVQRLPRDFIRRVLKFHATSRIGDGLHFVHA